MLAGIGWLILGIVVALVADWTTRELILQWWAPSAPAWVLAISLALRHRHIATGKQQLAINIDERLAVLPAVTPATPADPDDLAVLFGECRPHQAGIFQLRDNPERVPGRLYRKHQSGDESRARAAAERIRVRLLL